jgi:acetyl esterase/lipase
LQQAVWLIEHLRSDGFGLSAITLLGDSAGAHLLLSLLFHLSHPDPRVSPFTLDQRFSGAVLVSPWINLSTTSASLQSNADKDVLEAAALTYWAKNFLGSEQPSPWNNQLAAAAEWWHSLPVDNILVTYGDNEMLRDDISVLCDALKSHPKLTVCKAMGEVHAHMILNRFLRINKPSESENVFVKWLDHHLKCS